MPDRTPNLRRWFYELDDRDAGLPSPLTPHERQAVLTLFWWETGRKREDVANTLRWWVANIRSDHGERTARELLDEARAALG